MRTMLAVSVLLLLVQAPVSARAQCACLCVDGALKTVCGDPQDARDHPGLCGAAGARQACPAPPEASAAPERYAAPVDGVANCRDARIYDASSAGYVNARVCDAVPAAESDTGPG